MLHAILVSGTAGSKSPGDELWAFIPPSQLAKTVAQSGGVDGSPSVGDAFVDHRLRHQVLAHAARHPRRHLHRRHARRPRHHRSGQPEFLWEARDTITISGKTYVMGRAQGAGHLAGDDRLAGSSSPSSSPPTTPTATAATASTCTRSTPATALSCGANHTYANDTTHNDVPGTIASIDAAGDAGPATKVYFGDLEGKVWAVDAATGLNSTTLYDAAAGHTARPTRSTIPSRAAWSSTAIPTTRTSRCWA